MKPQKPEFTDEQKAYFRECGRIGGKSKSVTEKSRASGRKSMTDYWERVRSGEIKHTPVKKPKQQELNIEPME